MKAGSIFKKLVKSCIILGFKIGIVTILMIFGSCNGNTRGGLSTDIIQNGKIPKLTFTETFHDFGEINEGDIVTYTFDFTNTGDGDLLITDAHAQCSCTVPEWPKDIIKPGGKGIIRVKFDSNGKSGNVTKIITIEANTNPKISTLRIKANIHETPIK